MANIYEFLALNDSLFIKNKSHVLDIQWQVSMGSTLDANNQVKASWCSKETMATRAWRKDIGFPREGKSGLWQVPWISEVIKQTLSKALKNQM